VARVDDGLLLPLSGLRNVVLDVDPAHAVHMLMAYRH